MLALNWNGQGRFALFWQCLGDLQGKGGVKQCWLPSVSNLYQEKSDLSSEVRKGFVSKGKSPRCFGTMRVVFREESELKGRDVMEIESWVNTNSPQGSDFCEIVRHWR